MTTNAKARALREMLSGHQLRTAVGAHNGLTAKLVEQAGFDTVWLSSLELSASFGLPDIGLLTMTEFLEAAAAAERAVDIPVIADCDTGFGNARNVAYMVDNYDRRGIAGVCIEDQVFPKINSLTADEHRVVSIGEFQAKIAAAKAAQRSPDFVVIARVEALIAGLGMAEALDRATAYADSGADAVLIHSKATAPDEVFEFARRWSRDIPIVVVPTTYSSVTEQDLAGTGVRLVIYANHGLRAAVRAIQDTFSELHQHQSAARVEGGIATLKEVFTLQGMTH